MNEFHSFSGADRRFLTGSDLRIQAMIINQQQKKLFMGEFSTKKIQITQD